MNITELKLRFSMPLWKWVARATWSAEVAFSCGLASMADKW